LKGFIVSSSLEAIGRFGHFTFLNNLIQQESDGEDLSTQAASPLKGEKRKYSLTFRLSPSMIEEI
jgi:hypothetical protein